MEMFTNESKTIDKNQIDFDKLFASGVTTQEILNEAKGDMIAELRLDFKSKIKGLYISQQALITEIQKLKQDLQKKVKRLERQQECIAALESGDYENFIKYMQNQKNGKQENGVEKE